MMSNDINFVLLCVKPKNILDYDTFHDRVW